MNRERELDELRQRVQATRGRLAGTAEMLAGLAGRNGKRRDRARADEAADVALEASDDAHRIFSDAIAEAFVAPGAPAHAPAHEPPGAEAAVVPTGAKVPASGESLPFGRHAVAPAEVPGAMEPLEVEQVGNTVRELAAGCAELAADHPLKVGVLFVLAGAVAGRRFPLSRLERTQLAPFALGVARRTKAFFVALGAQASAIAYETVQGALEGATRPPSASLGAPKPARAIEGALPEPPAAPRRRAARAAVETVAPANPAKGRKAPKPAPKAAGRVRARSASAAPHASDGAPEAFARADEGAGSATAEDRAAEAAHVADDGPDPRSTEAPGPDA